MKTECATEGVYGRFLEEAAICGRVAQLDVDWRDGGGEDRFPILDTEWRIDGEVGPEAHKFLEEAEVSFAIEAARRVVKDGTTLAKNTMMFDLLRGKCNEFT